MELPKLMLGNKGIYTQKPRQAYPPYPQPRNLTPQPPQTPPISHSNETMADKIKQIAFWIVIGLVGGFAGYRLILAMFFS